MTRREIAACMRDLAEFGWVLLLRTDQIAALVAVLRQLNLEHTVTALGSCYMVQCAMEGDSHTEVAKGGYLA